ncbi:hypothetical protein BpHYR1_025242 [Brachionus plicatilis]|uniref:Uncharacterized protein n=1 Tax=Brachionus plicatilis TaxID=10195 RepID=A0A3M7PNK6_BRAPC|nr:hypothetical protein BpHYR1_025242 [Brachionus plicatilis]
MQIYNIESERDKLKIVNENLKLQLSQMEERFKNEKVQKVKCQNSNVEAKSYDNNNNSTSISTVTANVNCSSDSNISQIKTSSHETDSIVKLKRQSEFEHHRILKSDRNKRTIEDTVKVSSSVSNKAGDKASEMATWSNKAQINYDCNEITIPIIREQKVNTKPPILQSQFFSSTYKNASYTQNDEIKNLPREKIEEKNASEKLESKNPKSILKPSAVCSSYKLNKTSGKALTFGENEILET